jgi:hypothetical protein
MSTWLVPAHGWLPVGAHFQVSPRSGRCFATGPEGALQAPGNGEVLDVLSDEPFPDGFGSGYPVVRVDSGPWGGHEYYLGHTTSLLKARERFAFGRPLAIADQGNDWAGTIGGWVELGEAAQGRPVATPGRAWFADLLVTPMVARSSPAPIFRESGVPVWGFTSRLRDCGYLPRPRWRFDRETLDALTRFKIAHNLPVNHGVYDDRTAIVLEHAVEVCRQTKRKEA